MSSKLHFDLGDTGYKTQPATAYPAFKHKVINFLASLLSSLDVGYLAHPLEHSYQPLGMIAPQQRTSTSTALQSLRTCFPLPPSAKNSSASHLLPAKVVQPTSTTLACASPCAPDPPNGRPTSTSYSIFQLRCGLRKHPASSHVALRRPWFQLRFYHSSSAQSRLHQPRRWMAYNLPSAMEAPP
jgi:hypothetical protein